MRKLIELLWFCRKYETKVNDTTIPFNNKITNRMNEIALHLTDDNNWDAAYLIARRLYWGF